MQAQGQNISSSQQNIMMGSQIGQMQEVLGGTLMISVQNFFLKILLRFLSNSGPKRDIVGELEKSFKSDGRVKFGLYHSMFEWFHPLYLQDAASNFTVDDFVKTKMTPELTDLIMKYKVKCLLLTLREQGGGVLPPI